MRSSVAETVIPWLVGGILVMSGACVRSEAEHVPGTAPIRAAGNTPGQAAAQTEGGADAGQELEIAFANDAALSASEKSNSEQAILNACAQVQGLSVDAVECRVTRCRLEITTSDADEMERAIQRLFGFASKPLLNMGGTVAQRVTVANGSVTATVFLNR